MRGQPEFHWYAGTMLAQLLPYRKKNLLFGPQVCEGAAVKPMWKAAFFLGDCLALADAEAAREILDMSASPSEWRSAYGDIINDLQSRHSRAKGIEETYEEVFPEASAPRSDVDGMLMTSVECTSSIGQRVLLGITWGLLFPETGKSMLEAWVSQKRDWASVGIGGLTVQDTPQFKSVEEGLAQAQSLYSAWSRG